MSTVFLRVDGEPVEGQGAALATDRGLGYGDGVFRTMRLRAGAIPAWALHRAKLVADAGRIGLAIGSEALDRLERDLGDLVAVCSEATVRITVTAGSGPRGYRRSPSTAARILLRAESTDDLPTLAGESVAVRLCVTFDSPSSRGWPGSSTSTASSRCSREPNGMTPPRPRV